MLKKYIAILGLLVLLISLLFGGTFQVPTASAQDGENNKISSLLSIQVKAKLRTRERAPLAEGRVDILQAMQATGAEVTPLDKQRIFIHSVEALSQSQMEQLEAMGLTVHPDSWIPPVKDHPTGFIIADMPLDKLNELAGKNYVIRLDTAERFLEPQNDLATQKINADDVWSANYTGTGVKIAVLDSGLDVTHNDIPAPTDSKDYSNYPTLDDTIANTVIGHGTHVTGSALGRGTQSSGNYTGTAPGADLVFLKIGSDATGGASTAAMVNAIKAAVDTYNADIITVSYGGWDSYHDGTSQEAQAVDYAVSQGAVVFISAGNEANDNQHYSGTVGASSNTSYIQVNVTNAGTEDTFLWFNLVWYDGLGTNNNLTMQFYDSGYNPLSSINDAQGESTRGTEARFSYWGPESSFLYYVPSGSHTYYVTVTNSSSASQFFHTYVWYAGAGSVTFQNPDLDYTISSPADADSAIAVGAYTTRKVWYDYANIGWQWTNETVNQISTFSSRGPRVDTGAPSKPNIVAPGTGIISARDNDVYPWPSGADNFYIDNDGPNTDNATKNDSTGPADYYMMLGTSMASPLAAGVAALILEKNPTWTPAQVKSAIEFTAADEGDSGHDSIYGWGLIDALAALSYDPIPPTMEPISESQGQYYNTAPVFSNLGFDDDVALDDGWYQMDSYSSDNWTALFTDATGTSSDNDSWPIPGFGGLSEGSHTIYFKASDDTGNVEGESGEWNWQFYKDTTPPTDPTSVNSTSHTTSVWSSDNTVDISWTDATDNLSDLDGYSILWNTDNATAIPNTNKDIEEGVQSANSSALADGNSHYFHIRSKDNVGNWQSTVHLGPFFIDTVPPTDPTSVNSTSHTASVWSSDNTVDIAWTDATDSTSLLDGYSVIWDTNPTTIPDPTKNIEEGVQSDNSSALADGNSHYFHIRSVDNAGNWQSTVHLGPFFIDATPPTNPTGVSSTSHTASVWSSDNTVDISWIDATDSLSGLDGYSILWDTNPTTIPDPTKNIEEGVQSASSSALANGNSHYFHIRSVDIAGNWQSTVHLGPFFIAVNSPALSGGAVSPTSGYTSATFTYSVNYTDFENDAPSSITISIDGGTSENMTARTGQDDDFTNGEIYEYTTTGANLGAGTHTFQFAASDGTDNAIGDTNPHSGPTVSSPPAPPPAGGGGGGGGGGAAGVTPVLGSTTEKGRFTEDVTAKSEDKDVELFILKDTIGRNRVGSLLTSIRIKEMEDPPAQPEQTNVVGLVYDIGPNGAYFDPPIDLTIKYDESLIPEGVAEKNLIVATWDKTASKWLEFESTVDPEVDTITAKVSHFTAFTILAPTRPASFKIVDLSITPKEVDLGEVVSVSVLISNTGDLTGSYEVILKIDDVVAETKEVALDGGDSETISFSVALDTAGKHRVDISGLRGTCVVKAPPAPAAFTTGALTIYRAEVNIGESVTISVTLTNTGALTGTHEVALKIDNVVVSTKEVTLAGGTSEKVTFTTAKDVAGTYTLDVNGRLGAFTVKAPAAFTTSTLSISPNEVSIEEGVSVTSLVTNTGDLTGTHEVTLKIDNVVVASKDVTLAGGASQKVTFTTAKDVPGTYTVDVNGLLGTFTVRMPTVPAKPINWWLIGGGIIAGVVLLGLASYFLVKKRGEARSSN